MTQEESLNRINALDIKTIKSLSSDTMVMLTHSFKESLVKALLCRATTNGQQRELISAIKKAYKKWKKDTDIMWSPFLGTDVYPDYMDRMQLDIECNMIVTKDGTIPAPKEEKKTSKFFSFPYVDPAQIAVTTAYKAYQAAHGHTDDEIGTSNEESKRENIDQEHANLKKQLDEANNTIEKLMEEISSYKEKKKGINQHLTAVFGVKLAKLLGISYTNKKHLAPMLSSLFGWGKRKLEQELCSYISEEDEMELANIFGDLSPEIAKRICFKWEGKNSSKNAKAEE